MREMADFRHPLALPGAHAALSTIAGRCVWDWNRPQRANWRRLLCFLLWWRLKAARALRSIIFGSEIAFLLAC